MFDFKLKVFHTVASRLSFSKAAEELHITQPAITRHIKQIEAYYKQKLFERQGNRIALTQAGEHLLKYSKAIFSQYDELNFEMNSLLEKTTGTLNISASTTIAQYVLPEVLAKFHQSFPEVQLAMNSQNTIRVEQAILDKTIELGFIEGSSKNREIAYHPFMADEIVLVVSRGNPLIRKEHIGLNELYRIPLVLREQGSGTRQVVMDALENQGVNTDDLSIEMGIGSSEGIKNYLSNRKSAAFLSTNAILKELKNGELFIIDIDNLSITRDFYYITLQGHQSSLSSLFLNFITHHYNKKL
ncbi:LysR family transcriptional regulator [Flavobacteriaceae bacterium R38]|nr:LysR family transcriptional regulator [Flavobacteriaceae bacterium R38]